VPPGHLQLETGCTFTFQDQNGTSTQVIDLPEPLLRIGLLDDRFEFRATMIGYVWSRTNTGDGSGNASSDGWSDIALGCKVKVFDQSGWMPRLALDATTTVGGGSTNISSRQAEPILRLLWSYDLAQCFGEKWNGYSISGNADIAWPTSNGEHFTQGQASVYFTYPICDKVTGFVEWFMLAPNFKGSNPSNYADFGASYLLDNRVQLDGRVGFGLGAPSANVFFGFGISFLF
jgi:hypothetical protein